MTTVPTRITMQSPMGTKLSVIVAGKKEDPAVLLLHGFPNAAHMFRAVMPVLAQSCYVIAPDLPGFGQSDVLPVTSFDAYTTVISGLLEHLEIGSRFIYLHDYGTPVGIRLAMNFPHLVEGLIIQNANVHRSGLGPQWKDTMEFWARPNPENTAAATAHLTFEGVRDQYLSGASPEVTKAISPALWEEDWRVMSLPGRLEAQRSLVADYAQHVAQFDAIADYLEAHQPPALMLWGRHDVYFDIAETLSWMEDLPRMEAHIFDAGHLLLETHSEAVAPLIHGFVKGCTHHDRK